MQLPGPKSQWTLLNSHLSGPAYGNFIVVTDSTDSKFHFKGAIFRFRRSGTPLGTPTMSASMMQSSFVVEETEMNSVELFGSSLPVTVTEILTVTESESSNPATT